MNVQLPQPDYATETEFRWPWWKFRLPPEALFTSLHDRFNTRSSAIQDPHAFHRDVVECADNAASEVEFYDRLATRKHERISEINDAWAEISCLLGGTPAIWSCPRFGGHEQDDDTGNDSSASRWGAFLHLCRNMSLDCLVMFFDEYARDERKRQDRQRKEAWRNLDKLCPPRRVNTGELVDDAKLPESTQGGGIQSELNVTPASTDARRPILEAVTSHLPPDNLQASLPSPPSASSILAETPPNKGEKGRSSKVVSGTALSKDEKDDLERINTDLSCIGETLWSPPTFRACVPNTPDSSHNETVRAEATDHAGDDNRQQPRFRASSRVLKRSPRQSDSAVPSIASSSSALYSDRVVEEPVPSLSAATCSSSPQSAKRTGCNYEEGPEDSASTWQVRKRRRLA